MNKQKLKLYYFKAVKERRVNSYGVHARSAEKAIQKVIYGLEDWSEEIGMTGLMEHLSLSSKEEMEAEKPFDPGEPPSELLERREDDKEYILRTIEDQVSYYTVEAYSTQDAWDSVYSNFKEGTPISKGFLAGPEVISEDELKEEMDFRGPFATRMCLREWVAGYKAYDDKEEENEN